MRSSSQLKIAVIGGGIAGAEVVRNALPRYLDITLIEPKSQIECQALYPEYLAGAARLEDLTAPLKPFCDRM
jgi:NADH dehydrogenase